MNSQEFLKEFRVFFNQALRILKEILGVCVAIYLMWNSEYIVFKMINFFGWESDFSTVRQESARVLTVFIVAINVFRLILGWRLYFFYKKVNPDLKHRILYGEDTPEPPSLPERRIRPDPEEALPKPPPPDIYRQGEITLTHQVVVDLPSPDDSGAFRLTKNQGEFVLTVSPHGKKPDAREAPGNEP